MGIIFCHVRMYQCMLWGASSHIDNVKIQNCSFGMKYTSKNVRHLNGGNTLLQFLPVSYPFHNSSFVFCFFPPLFQKCNHLLSLVICRISANTHKCKTGITRRGRNIVLCIQCIALSCFVLYCIILGGGGCGSFSSHTRIWDDKF